uniref:Putative 23.4 kDa salivary protein n=1 Tax=Psorophora albipes TaxID=869069 RepID=T1D4U7_9DIPT
MFTAVTLLAVLLFHLTSGTYYGDSPYSRSAAIGCLTQQGCASWNFHQYPCYRTCYLYYNCVTHPPKKKCYKLTHQSTGKTLTSSEIYDATKKLKFATASRNAQTNCLWTLESTYGGVYNIRSSDKFEYLMLDSNNQTYLVQSEPTNRLFQFRMILSEAGWSRVQIQSAFNNGFLFVSDVNPAQDSIVQITFDPFKNYYQTLWAVNVFYC